MEVEDANRMQHDIRRRLSRFARNKRRAVMNLKRRAILPPTHTNINALRYLRKQISKHARLRRKITIISSNSKLLVPQKLELTIQCLNRFAASMTVICNDRQMVQHNGIVDNERHINVPNAPPMLQEVSRDIPWNFGPPTHTCIHCGAILWYEERTRKDRKLSNPKFTFCCLEGRVQLPLTKEPPHLLSYLLGYESGQKGVAFRKDIRTFNAMFAFTSIGGRVDTSVNCGKGPYIYRISGQNYHRMGSLLPNVGKQPQFAQLYIYDTQNETSNRINTMRRDCTALDVQLTNELSEMLEEHNMLVQSFRMARDRYEAEPNSAFRLRLITDRSSDGRQYNIPSADEVAGLIVGDLSDSSFERDIIVEHRTYGLQRINDIHPCFMALSYPLIHPFGEDGFRQDIQLRKMDGDSSKRQLLTMRQYFCFRLQQRLCEGHTLLRSGRLLQQYIVDAYTAVEEGRFRWIRNNQKKLRSDVFSGLVDAVSRGDSDSSKIGKSIILPSSHTGGPRYRIQNYQDAMAICKWAGYPDLFLTFTCNPKWPEINEMLTLIGQQDDHNRVDIICRVFEIKLRELMVHLKTKTPFGKITASLYTIEFQKRGLPHAHILLFLESEAKIISSDEIDKFITAEIPNANTDLDAFSAVTRFMMHGPCGDLYPNSPCMKKGKCSKHFPKSFNTHTTIDTDGFPIYKRRDTGAYVEKNKRLLDNRFVVPHNRNLVVKFDAHINVELCNHSRAIKYLFKYIHKGSDRTTATLQSSDTPQAIDEIRTYLDCRYISASEACWRLFQFDIHSRHPAVERLPFHLPGEHTVTFEEDTNLEAVVNKPGVEKTKFTEWMESNRKHEDARKLSYSEFPTKWVWNSQNKEWTKRQKGIAIGRIYFTHPSAGERFYMHDDKEWIDCLEEAATWASGHELRNLFVTILTQCQVSNAVHLWKTHYETLSEDIGVMQRRKCKSQNMQRTDGQIKAYTLFEIESIMQKMGKSLRDIDGMPLPDTTLLREVRNRLVNEELDYNRDDLKVVHINALASLNRYQRVAYNAIISSVYNDESQLIFIHGRGGTGKTFLWNTVVSKLRSEGKIVLPVATSGIAALFLPNGRTAHSRFHIPLDITPESTCDIKHGTCIAELLQKTELIIWDEAPMASKYCFKALDRSLRDILSTRYPNSSTKPFGGLTVVCGGDFRQILPVIPKGTRADIVDASLNSSYLWPMFRVYELNQNMRLHSEGVSPIEALKIETFDKWMLNIGDGSVYADPNEELLQLPPKYSPTEL